MAFHSSGTSTAPRLNTARRRRQALQSFLYTSRTRELKEPIG